MIVPQQDQPFIFASIHQSACPPKVLVQTASTSAICLHAQELLIWYHWCRHLLIPLIKLCSDTTNGGQNHPYQLITKNTTIWKIKSKFLIHKTTLTCNVSSYKAFSVMARYKASNSTLWYQKIQTLASPNPHFGRNLQDLDLCSQATKKSPCF